MSPLNWNMAIRIGYDDEPCLVCVYECEVAFFLFIRVCVYFFLSPRGETEIDILLRKRGERNT